MLTCIKEPRIKPVDNIYPDKSRIKYPLGTILQTRTQSSHWRHTTRVTNRTTNTWITSNRFQSAGITATVTKQSTMRLV
jgi:hypothetical protein